MGTVTVERQFKADRQKVFDFVSRTDHILKWWGPEASTIPEHNIAFDKTGPWMVVIRSSEGKRYKVSGQVTHVDDDCTGTIGLGLHRSDPATLHDDVHVIAITDTDAVE